MKKLWALLPLMALVLSMGMSQPGLGAALAADTGIEVTDLCQQVIDQMNAKRVFEAVDELEADETLQEAAEVRAQEIAKTFSHTRPDGTAWYTVSDKAHGENLAMGHLMAEKVVTDWMGSEGHRKNIVNEEFHKVGVASIKSGDTRYWVVLFGRGES